MEVTKCWRKSNNEKLHNPFCSFTIFRVNQGVVDGLNT